MIFENDNLQTVEDAKTSDRELARIIVEMFAGTGLSVVVAFSDTQQAAKASKRWADSFDGKIIVLDEKSKKKDAPSSKAFKKPSAVITPTPKKSAIADDTGTLNWIVGYHPQQVILLKAEVLVIVSPEAKHLDAIEKLAREVGLLLRKSFRFFWS